MNGNSKNSEPKRRASSWKISGARRGHPARPGETKSLLLTAEELATKFVFGHSIIHRYLRAVGKASKSDQWVPHKLSKSNRAQRVNVCSSHEWTFFWIEYWLVSREGFSIQICQAPKRVSEKGEILVPPVKEGLHPRKMLLFVWCYIKGLVRVELLKPN